MNAQIHCSSAFKRFANASQADMAKIREDRFEQGRKQSTIWAVKVFEGKSVMTSVGGGGGGGVAVCPSRALRRLSTCKRRSYQLLTAKNPTQ